MTKLKLQSLNYRLNTLNSARMVWQPDKIQKSIKTQITEFVWERFQNFTLDKMINIAEQ